MPNYTPNFNLVKPLGTEQFDEANDNNNMDILDNQLKTLTDALDARLDVLEAAPANFTDKITVAANWTLDTQNMYKMGRLIHLHFQFTKTNAAVAAVSDGNFVNTLMGTLPAGYRPGTRVAWSTTTTGRGSGGYLNEAGDLVISWGMPGIAHAIGDVVTGSVTYVQVN